ncbi:MAG: GTPase Era [Burkholderiales bacterium]|nr:GTPase Era [Burkholderiales bacterium]
MVAIVGRPNVGKSTLLNRLVGRKVSITSAKPQTTRHRIIGIHTTGAAQIVFVDTPGFQTREGGALNRVLNRTVRNALEGSDLVLFVVEAGRFGAPDRAVLDLVPRSVPVVLVVNKSDTLRGPSRMLPFLERATRARAFAEAVPVSARTGRQVGELVRVIAGYLPEQPPLYGADEITDRSERFLAAELLREKVFRAVGEEVPYGATAVIDRFEEAGRLRRIHAAIVVEKPGQKAIVIGEGGEKLKAIASAARRDMEALFGGKVFLEVWVRVRKGWRGSAAELRRLGYEHG